MLTQERLKQLFHYDPDTGVFTRLVSHNNAVRVGETLGYIQRGNKCPDYFRGKVDGKAYLLHRLAFLYMTGAFPDEMVDHIDGNGLNNRWANLREVDDIDNARNRKLRITSESGCTGVYFNKSKQLWRADICNQGKKVYLGDFAHFQDAVNARLDAEKDYGYHENHGRRAA